jgi:hypothetical protein
MFGFSEGNVFLLLRKLPRLGKWLRTISLCGSWKAITIQMKGHLQMFYKTEGIVCSATDL